MCDYASFVLTKDKVFWSKKTESHHEIIQEFNLCECDSSGTRIHIVKTEIIPVKYGDLSTWKYQVDQDVFPPWYDKRDCEVCTRKGLRKKVGKAILKNFKGLDKFIECIIKTKFYKIDGRKL